MPHSRIQLSSKCIRDPLQFSLCYCICDCVCSCRVPFWMTITNMNAPVSALPVWIESKLPLCYCICSQNVILGMNLLMMVQTIMGVNAIKECHCHCGWQSGSQWHAPQLQTNANTIKEGKCKGVCSGICDGNFLCQRQPISPLQLHFCYGW